MKDTEAYETTEVVVCGCGPTGAMLSAYLGQLSVKHVMLERESGITTDPRGIALDEDGIRLLQGIGMYKPVYAEIGTCMNMLKFIGGTEKDLNKNAFAEMDYSTTEGGTGHVGFICHKQPSLEKHLRETMLSTNSSELRSDCSVFEITEDENWVYSWYRDADGKPHKIRSRFFIGADGKTGFTRKNYLEPLGIRMEQAHQAFYDETWVALNWEVTPPTPKTHPDFPLWSLGYTPEQVHDLFFPTNFRFLCNPNRPAVCGRFGLPSDRLWRFEFVVLPSENGEEMSQPEMIKKVVFPYLKHPGNRYGLLQDIKFPEDCIRVLRSRPFRFSARVCNRWSHGRVALCGDAAHVFPPFGGQGIASGFRDAASLAWRLGLLCRRQGQQSGPKLIDHENVFAGWYLERKQQLDASLASTIENGRFVTESNPIKIFIRSCLYFIMNLVPSWRRQIRLGRRKDGLVQYEKQSACMPFIEEYKGGLCLPQVYCKALNPKQQKGIFFTDDIIFAKHKTGLFQLLVYLKDIGELASAREMISDIDELSKGEIRAADVTFIIGKTDIDLSEVSKTQDVHTSYVFRIATGEEFAASSLCDGRPEPRFYDPNYLSKALNGRKFVLVRPDRFIYAACDNKRDIQSAVAKMVEYLQGPSGGKIDS